MHEVDLSQSLTKLEGVAAQLNEASNSINRILLDVEQRLVLAAPGLEVWLHRPLTSTDAQGSTHGETVRVVERLGFAKIKGKWCLGVKRIRIHEGYFQGDTSCPYTNEYLDDEPMPLLQASRECRIEGLRMLPELIEALREATEAAVKTIEETTQLVK